MDEGERRYWDASGGKVFRKLHHYTASDLPSSQGKRKKSSETQDIRLVFKKDTRVIKEKATAGHYCQLCLYVSRAKCLIEWYCLIDRSLTVCDREELSGNKVGRRIVRNINLLSLLSLLKSSVSIVFTSSDHHHQFSLLLVVPV